MCGHYLDGIEMDTVIFGLIPLEESHTGVYLSGKMEEALVDWGIPKKKVNMVVTDSAENIKLVVKTTFGSNKLNPCFDHVLQRVPYTS